ncbi:PQQ-dependent sugar dehydrogenase [Pseudomonas sp. DTU_2021_1001937_2_SI_NGA_ILE_001]|uniref:PQQ-dependent sugar dehydrogenase n=1 Tax=Pseudomonas sp. DTU_2021_1001937_2_SI_NGA_ILE_001 TaxID=3077589 RepID=UPI0025DF5B24|nr:PQQ-dependent sugar dehydrogenase [Pseudomonas sp. DTU_2021_1001937_2_SI_NGA_ILE_001]WNW13768.1 PQQ-dependent sugar dehydrogenase [Pseudomonas sp. DTU_2021_1001937_2_SI_NGA_ILE_001]
MLRKTLIATCCASLLAGLPFTVSAAETARYKSELGSVTVTPLAEGLDHPWALAFLPEKQGILVTERSGDLLLLSPDGKQRKALSGVPQVWAKGQGGLLDVALSPDFANDRMVYLAYAEGDGKTAAEGDHAGTAVGRGRLSKDLTQLEDFNVIFRQQPKLSVGNHFGARLVFDRQGYLFVTLGENNDRPTAQDLDKLQGKVVRIFPDGQVPTDNPFVDRKGVAPEIWSFGHRNPQGAALNPWSGTLWLDEHGPKGGDEINIVERAQNFGWPLATHGINYSGLKIPEAQGKEVEGTVKPFHVWEVSPGVSGMAFYSDGRFKAWDHNLFIGALATEELIRLQFEGDRIVHEERLLKERKERIRDVRQGPDGYLYLLTDDDKGKLLKVGLE